MVAAGEAAGRVEETAASADWGVEPVEVAEAVARAAKEVARAVLVERVARVAGVAAQEAA